MSDLLETPAPGDRDRPAVRVIEFWTEYVTPEDGGETRAVDWVKWARPGVLNMAAVCEAVPRLSKPLRERGPQGQMAYRPVWLAVKPSYDAWKTGQEIPIDGTPLDAWHGLTRKQAEALRTAGCRSVEEFAGLTDNEIGRVMLPDVRGLRGRAKAFLEARDRDAPVAAALAQRDAEIEALKKALADLMDRQDAAERPKGKAA